MSSAVTNRRNNPTGIEWRVAVIVASGGHVDHHWRWRRSMPVLIKLSGLLPSRTKLTRRIWMRSHPGYLDRASPLVVLLAGLVRW
jgi:hypothetical protein